MTHSWNDFIQSQGGINANDHTNYFSQAPFPDLAAPLLIDANYLTTLELNGPDCHKFLQGQMTQDVQLLAQGRGIFADHCNPKGRILGSFYALGAGPDRIRLLVPTDNADFLAAQLGKYLVFAKAKLTRNETLATLILTGAEPRQVLSALGLTTPAAPGAVAGIGTETIAYKRSCDEILLNLPKAQALALWPKLAPMRTLAGTRAWRVRQLQQGIAWIDSHNRERFTPHQLNHQCIDAISFRKGCYTGQEVIARMHYKATLKSHSYGFTLTADAAPEAGAPVYAAEQKVGEVITSEAIAATTWQLLADIKVDAIDEALHLANDGTQKLLRTALPYAINN